MMREQGWPGSLCQIARRRRRRRRRGAVG